MKFGLSTLKNFSYQTKIVKRILMIAYPISIRATRLRKGQKILIFNIVNRGN